jgi:hypothetical protein
MKRQPGQLDLFQQPAYRVLAEEPRKAPPARPIDEDEGPRIQTKLQTGDKGQFCGEPCEIVMVAVAYVKIARAGKAPEWVPGWLITNREPERGNNSHDARRQVVPAPDRQDIRQRRHSHRRPAS